MSLPPTLTEVVWYCGEFEAEHLEASGFPIHWVVDQVPLKIMETAQRAGRGVPLHPLHLLGG